MTKGRLLRIPERLKRRMSERVASSTANNNGNPGAHSIVKARRRLDVLVEVEFAQGRVILARKEKPLFAALRGC